MGRGLSTKNRSRRVWRSGSFLMGIQKAEVEYPVPEMALPSEQAAQSRGLGVMQELDRGVWITGLFLPRELDGWVFVELDVGSEGNADGSQIQEVLHRVISSGSIGPYVTSPWGFKFRRLGTGELVLQTRVTLPLQFPRLWPISVSLPWAFLTWTSTPMETRSSLHPEPEPNHPCVAPNCFL